MPYKVVLLDKTLAPITQVMDLAPMDGQGNFIEYTNVLSNVGTCKFRVATKDQMLTTYGDILQPFANHVRVYRDTALVWSGVIVNNPKRTRNYIDVEAKSYLFYLSKILLKHDNNDNDTYRTLNSGTMADNLQNLMTEAFARNPVLCAGWKIGTIENPNFPADSIGNPTLTDLNGTALTGAWAFSNNFSLKYDYRDMLYAIQMLGVYGNCDFELTPNLTFNFQKYIGTKQPDMVFQYGVVGGVEDYNVPLMGAGTVNRLTGVAADQNFNIISVKQDDTVSIGKYGILEGVAAFKDAKNSSILSIRLTEELRNISDPASEIHVVLGNASYPLGQYGLGDTVTIRIKDRIINVNQQRRIVGIDVKVHNTGRETLRLITNVPRNGQ